MKMICIEGIDAVGKETVSKALEKTLDSKGFKVIRVSFPIYEGDFGRCIKDVLMGACGEAPSLDPELMGPLYTLDRISYFKANIDRLLETYDYLICDRSFYSNFMYQASKLYIKNPILYSKDDISHPLANWISNNFKWEFDDTGLFGCTDVNTFVLTLSEEDSLKQLNNRDQKDTNESNRAYLSECKKFITHMMSDNVRSYAVEMMKHLSLKTKHHLLYYILNVHAIEVEHAENPDDIGKATMKTINKILKYLFPNEDIENESDTNAPDIDYKKFYNDFARINCTMMLLHYRIDEYLADEKDFKADSVEFRFNIVNGNIKLSIKILIKSVHENENALTYMKRKQKLSQEINDMLADKLKYIDDIDWNTFLNNKFDTPLLFTYDGNDFAVRKI